MESFQHHIVFVFNLQPLASSILWLLRSVTTLTTSISKIFNTLTFWSTTSSALWPFDQQHLQHFDLSISNIFSTLIFRSETSSSSYSNLSIRNIIIKISFFQNIIIIKASLSSKHHHHQNINMILPFEITGSRCLWYSDDPSCQNYRI